MSGKHWVGALLAVLSLLLCAGWAGAEAKWPAAPGNSLKKNSNLQVDADHTSEGYFLASLRKSSKRKIKLRVKKGQEMLTYDLNGDGEFEIFPLQLGDGKYEILLYENVSGKKYSSAGKITLNVKLSSEDICFYYPNQYVNYTETSEPVAKAAEICAGQAGEERYNTVCGFMKKNMSYDFIKAISVKGGELPDIEGCYQKKKGICQDLSALMCCMLRTQGIPARLMIGYADKTYHAWVEFQYNGKSYFFDPTAAVNGIQKVKTYSVERYY